MLTYLENTFTKATYSGVVDPSSNGSTAVLNFINIPAGSYLIYFKVILGTSSGGYAYFTNSS